MLEDISGQEVVDRLPILVSGQSVDQLLGVPKIESGSGELTATAVYKTVSSRGIADKIKSMSFDTTAVNTGTRNGACVLLEQKMQKDMLWLPCRHHILEIMLVKQLSFKELDHQQDQTSYCSRDSRNSGRKSIPSNTNLPLPTL